MKNKRKVMMVFLLIVVTILCVLLGIRTRYNKRIILTQLAGEGNGYIIETEKHNLIIIDGGTNNDSERIKEIIKEKGNPTVLAWFLTSPENNKSGALCEILNSDSEIKIENIYMSFISYGEWYQNLGLEPEELEKIYSTLNCIYADKNRDIVREMERRTQYQFDNYFITPLEVKDEEQFAADNLSNQTTILKVDNTFKNVIFIGDAGEEKVHYFKENDQDQFDCDYLQFSENKIISAGKEIFNAIKPKNTLISDIEFPSYVTSENIYTKQYGEITLEIW